MKVFVMSKIKSSSPALTVQSQKVSSLVNEYSLCVTKTAASILELASIVHRANTELSKQEYALFLREIKADKSKVSFLIKLNCIAKKASRFVAIQEKLPAAYTTLYDLSKLTNEEFERAQSEDLITPNLTAAKLSKFKFKFKAPKFSTISADKVTLTLKSSSASFHKVLQKIQTLCAANDIELKSSFDLTILKHQDFDEIQDASFRPVLKAA